MGERCWVFSCPYPLLLRYSVQNKREPPPIRRGANKTNTFLSINYKHSERPTDRMTCVSGVPRNSAVSSLVAKCPSQTSRAGAQPGSLWSASLWLGSEKAGSGPPVGEGSEGRGREGRGRCHHLRCGPKRDGGH